MTTSSGLFALDADAAARELRDITRIGAMAGGFPEQGDAVPGDATRSEAMLELILIRGERDEI